MIVCRQLCSDVPQVSAGKCISAMDHPPYSPDLVPAGFRLFPELTSVPKGKRFSDIENISSKFYRLKSIYSSRLDLLSNWFPKFFRFGHVSGFTDNAGHPHIMCRVNVNHSYVNATGMEYFSKDTDKHDLKTY
jgi:hypothetical protein